MNQIALKQIRTGELGVFITGVTYPYLSGASGELVELLLQASGELQSQINEIQLSGGSQSTSSGFRFSIPSGVDNISCNYGFSIPSAQPVITLASSGFGDPIIMGFITGSFNTGVKVSFSDYTSSPNYYISLKF